MKKHEPDSWRIARAGAWGMLAGAVASLCCIGPSAAILFGLGAASALFGFQLDQRVAFGAGLVLLVVGSVLAFRRSAVCNVGQGARWQSVALLLVTSIVVYAVLGVVAPRVAAYQEEAALPRREAPLAAAPARRQATLLVAKMECPPCVVHLRSLLTRTPFVVEAQVEGDNEQVIVVYDSRNTTVSELLSRIPSQYDTALVHDMSLP